ncbi:MAG: hypothetical protein HY435_01325 [Candidatus Liptonbacteria bacterium]|nr:hypothetical protein [Candidatus Liptonbacteria bacterium]
MSPHLTSWVGGKKLQIILAASFATLAVFLFAFVAYAQFPGDNCALLDNCAEPPIDFPIGGTTPIIKNPGDNLDPFGGGNQGPLPTFRDNTRETYENYPAAKIGTGILLDMGSILYTDLVKKANGIATEGLPQTFEAIKLSHSDLRNAYGDLRRSAFTNENLLPKADNLALAAQPIVEGGVNPIAIGAIDYNELNPEDFTNGRLSLFYEDGTPYPTSTPFNQDFQKNWVRGDGRISYVKETPASSTTPLTSLFFGTGFLNEKADGTIGNYLLFSLPSQFAIKNPASKTVTDLAIRFPGVPRGDGISPDTFIPVELDQKYPWDMSRATFVQEAPPGVTMVAHLTYHIRATIDGQVRYAVGTVDYYPPPGGNRGTDCSIPKLLQGKFPKVRPVWWPEAEWPPQTSAGAFFNATSTPPWWNSAEIPWPVFFAPYRYTIADLSQVIDWLGIHDQEREDPKVTGPLYADYLGNTASGILNTRIYPATYRKPVFDPDRCFVKNLVILVDGFDIEQNRTPTTLYRDLEPTVNKMRDKGYDVLLVDYANGQDFIQRNAFALMEILKNIHLPKPWLTMKPGYENQRAIVMAGSMGTQVTRYALAKLEGQNIDHHTGLWIAIDGPFVGAHIPVSLQGLFDFLSQFNDDAIPFRIAINSPAAKELLRRHYNTGLVFPDSYHSRFYDEVRALNGGTGMPQKLRKVAMSQGSGQGLTQDNVVKQSNDFLARTFEHLESITFRSLWYGLDIDARTEGVSRTAGERILDAWVTKPAGFIIIPNPLDPFGPPIRIPIGRSLYLSYEYEILSGWQDLDMIPGGSTFAARKLKDKFNNSTAPAMLRCENGPPCNITSQLDHSPFIPLFSALNYEAAGTSSVTENVTTRKEISYGWVTEVEYGVAGPQTVPSDIWYAPEDQSKFGFQMDPNVKSNSPFDAIWYEPVNVEHVFTAGVRPPTSTEAFIFNELDRFTSQEEFSNKLLWSDGTYADKGKIPSSDIVLVGDMTGCGNEVLTVNTMTKKFMVQQFRDGIWNVISQGQGSLGAWTIDKGDRFFLPETRLFALEGRAELLSISAGTPARAMLQKIFRSGGFDCATATYSWETVWDNRDSVSGIISGMLGPWKLHPTDMIIFGNIGNFGNEPDEREEMLIMYPYIGNNARERFSPGAGGISEASIIRFRGGADPWQEMARYSHQLTASSVCSPRGCGNESSWPIRFGDQFNFLNLDAATSTQSLFSTIGLLNIFQGRDGDQNRDGVNDGTNAQIQNFNTAFNDWVTQWNDSPDRLVTPRVFGTIGSWNLGVTGHSLEDAFLSADIDGDGVDELISHNPSFLHAQNFNAPSSTWSLKYFTGPLEGSMFGVHQLRSGDRLYAGNVNAPNTRPNVFAPPPPDEETLGTPLDSNGKGKNGRQNETHGKNEGKKLEKLLAQEARLRAELSALISSTDAKDKKNEDQKLGKIAAQEARLRAELIALVVGPDTKDEIIVVNPGTNLPLSVTLPSPPTILRYDPLSPTALRGWDVVWQDTSIGQIMLGNWKMYER